MEIGKPKGNRKIDPLNRGAFCTAFRDCVKQIQDKYDQTKGKIKPMALYDQ